MSTPATSLYVNADWSALVPAGSVEAAFGLTVEEAKRRGLLPLASGDTFGEPERIGSVVPKPEPVKAEPEPVLVVEPEVVEAPDEPEPEAKQAPAPANKAAKKPRNK